jgi:ribonuclease J
MIHNVNMAINLGYLRVPAGTLLRLDELPRVPHEQLVVVTTGSQGEPSSALTRMANGDQKHIQIVKGDTVIISSSPIPGNEELVARNIDNLFKLGADVVYDRHEQVHVSGHGAQDELKLMIGLLRPTYLIPIHGQYRHLVMHGRLAIQMGVAADNVLLIDNGTILEASNGQIRRAGKIDASYVYVDGLGVGDIGDVVLRDRRALARDGVLVVVVPVERQTGRAIGLPDLISRGFVHDSNADALIEKARQVVYDALESHHPDTAEWAYTQTKIKEALGKFLYKETKRRPMILPVVMEV